MRILYFAQIQSILTYGIGIWGTMVKKTDIDCLQKIQDNCMHTMLSINKKVMNVSYKELQILPLKKLIHLEQSKLCYKLCNDMLPSKLTEILLTDQHARSIIKDHQYNTRRKHIPNRPPVTSNTYQKSYLYNLIAAYSDVPTKIRETGWFQRFVISCKKHPQKKE